MIKEISWPIWLLILSLFVTFILIVGIGIQAIKSNASQKEQITIEMSSQQIDEGLELHTETKESDSFTSFVSVPFLSEQTIDIPIKEWVEEQEEFFQKEITSTNDTKAHLNIQSDVGKLSEDIISINLQVEHFFAKETIYTHVKTFTIDRKNNRFINLQDIFDHETFESNTLYKLIEKQLREVDGKFLDPLQNISFDQLIWAINDEHISFYFNPNVLIHNEEIVQIDIPIVEFHQYLVNPYKDMIINDEIKEEIIEQKKVASQKPRKLDKDGKYVALTFDDGPHNTVTSRILDTLKTYNAKATFFMLSRKVENNPELALKVALEGHEIANHTHTHVNLNAVKAKRIKTEVQNSLERIENAIGIKPITFRPPYGEYNDKVVKYAAESEQVVVNWSVDSLDWKSRDAKAIYDIVRKDTKPGSIILFHDIHEPTADALPKIMEYLTEENYEFVTVSELLPLLDDKGYGPYFGK